MNKLNEEINRMLGMTKSMNELDIVDTNSEANKFLGDVKARVPDKYARVYSVYRTKGLDAAKEFFAQYDPVVLKQRERERKSAETKEKAKMKITDMRSLVVGKAELAELIESNVLTEDYRRACQRLNFPQLVSTNFEPKVRITQRELSVGLRIESRNVYSPGPEGMAKFANDLKKNDTDALLDDIIKLKKAYSSDQKIKKWAQKGGYGDAVDFSRDMEYFSNITMTNVLRLSYGVNRWGIGPSVQCGGGNTTVFSIMGHQDEELIRTKQVYKNQSVTDEQLTKELIINQLKVTLKEIHNDIMAKIAQMEREARAHDIMRKGMENPGLNENS